MRAYDGWRGRVLARREKAVLAVALTWVAGFVDVVGFVLFQGIYTANMSGNTIDVGRALPDATFGPMLRHLSAILYYTAGMVAGRIVVDYAARHRVRAIASITLTIEAAMLVALMYFGSVHPYPAEPWPFYGLIGLAAVAMGFQNITVTHVGALRCLPASLPERSRSSLNRLPAIFSGFGTGPKAGLNGGSGKSCGCRREMAAFRNPATWHACGSHTQAGELPAGGRDKIGLSIRSRRPLEFS